MAKLPQIRKLLLADFKTQKDWIQPLLLIYNNFSESVVSAFNKGITVVDNMTSDIKQVQLNNVPTPSTTGGAVGPTSIPWTKTNSLPQMVLVGAVQLLTGSPLRSTSFVLATAVQVQWQMSQDNKSLQITGVVGITPSSTNQYVLTLLCIAG